ncbi:hypothetical protein M6D93_06730 [Jatrophihabitans telluris]|uniref:Uncharacterized protein n=1 Tax=Jatrophihabitans telluris TaxID=2038343 RepID=A0ABY4R1L1_9ACTN|nr:hypothetical protein [Jatrophihabitans telluris]UQX89690.1 hypothetical protein M6D93_06730 [Jatrophihabitans telluris]
MRWTGLFDDLEAQAIDLFAAERSAEVADRTRGEFGRVQLSDRLRPALGSAVRLRCVGAQAVNGHIRRVGAEWVLIDEGFGREALVLLTGVLTVSGLGRLSSSPGSAGVVESRLGLRHVLRALIRDRSGVQLALVDGTIAGGTLDRLGRDFVELAAHPAGEARRGPAVREVLLVPLSGLVLVRRDE